MPVNVFGKRQGYMTELDRELLRVKELYPSWKRPFEMKHRLAAVAFYRDSHSDDAKFIEIGRLADTAKAKAAGAGHVQSSDLGNWTPIANDCWMLGGFHSSKVFRLNTLSFDAVWDESRPGTSGASYAFPVTRRELTGLLEFGFKPTANTSGTITFECTMPEKVFGATLEQYAATTTLEKRTSKMVSDFINEFIG